MLLDEMSSKRMCCPGWSLGEDGTSGCKRGTTLLGPQCVSGEGMLFSLGSAIICFQRLSSNSIYLAVNSSDKGPPQGVSFIDHFASQCSGRGLPCSVAHGEAGGAGENGPDN